MIVKGFRRTKVADEQVESAKGFDAFDLRLGDLMRGERATMGKSLLDVQRELKIKAAYIAAIENSDPSAFDTPGFIAGYVRSYARYLHMDPDWAFETFCRESGFETAHGMSAAASSVNPAKAKKAENPFQGKDIFSSASTPFIPAGEAVFSRIEPGQIGSLAVLIALIGGLGYGGWSVLQELQRVQFAPVEQTPVVLSDLDPLAGASAVLETPDISTDFQTPSPDALDRLYRPQALDVPVLVARDAPISTLRPGDFGTLAPMAVDPGLAQAVAEAEASPTAPTIPQVSEGPAPEVVLVAAREAWVRVRAADGSTIYEAIMNTGDTFTLPATEDPATLRVGDPGALYFAVNGTVKGPAGASGQPLNLSLAVDTLETSFDVADLDRDTGLAEAVRIVAQANSATVTTSQQNGETITDIIIQE